MAVGTTVFLAGAELETLTRALLDCGVKSILYSYFLILQMKREDFIARIQDEYPEVNWFLDCGSYTYSNADRDDLPPVKKYVRRYFAYIEECGERFCRVTEPDMDIGGEDVEQVDDWREEMLDRWPHLNITPVWHTGRGRETWYEYLHDERIKTLAVGSGDIHHAGIGAIRRLVMDAASVGKPVHGFGCTRVTTTLRQVPFDSVDSTSWLMGQKVGTTFIFRASKFITIPLEKKYTRNRYKTYFKNIGCDPKLVIADNVAQVRRANIIAWKGLADRLEYLKSSGRQTHGVNNSITTVEDALVMDRDHERVEHVARPRAPKPLKRKKLQKVTVAKVQLKQRAAPAEVLEPRMPTWFPGKREED